MNAEQFAKAVEVMKARERHEDLICTHEKAIEDISKEIEALQAKCEHLVTKGYGDPATGRVDNQCVICEKWL